MWRTDRKLSSHRLLRDLVGILALVSLFLLAGITGYHAYFSTPALPEISPLPAQHPRMAERAVLFIIDGFHPGHAFDPVVMPTLVRLAAQGSSGISHTDSVTLTGPCIYSLTTGRPGTLGQAIFNFHSSETRADSLLSLVAAQGGEIILSGDFAWHQQFGWLVPPENRYRSREAGVTVDRWIDKNDTKSVEFLLRKFSDPAYRLGIVHLGSVDAVGHRSTPLSGRYLEQLQFVDGLLERVISTLDLNTTVLLVTGDHGMGARGTHGGEGEARQTPYVLAGPGVRSGFSADIAQPALSSTLCVLLGLPFLPLSEHPPVTGILDISDARAIALEQEYLTSKLRAVSSEKEAEALHSFGGTTNQAINKIMFGTQERAPGLRWLTILLAGVGICAAAMICRSQAQRLHRLDLTELLLYAAAPVVIGLLAVVFLSFRDSVAVRSSWLAAGAMMGLFLASFATGLLAYRSSRLVDFVERRQLALFFFSLVVLHLPLVLSAWLNPAPFFEVLFVAGALILAVLNRPWRMESWVGLSLIVVATSVTIFVVFPATSDLIVLQLLLSALVLVLALRNLRGASFPVVSGRICLAGTFTAVWLWRLTGAGWVAVLVLFLFLGQLLLSLFLKGQLIQTSTVLIGAACGLFLMMASDAREGAVFLTAAAAALLLCRIRIELDSPRRLYLFIGVAFLLRICLYFALGDQYKLNSIRTAPGFLVSGNQFSLSLAVALLIIKYALPWILILGIMLSSLATCRRSEVSDAIKLLALGYVARFAMVAALIDPFRAVPNGEKTLVGVFCLSWAEFVSFGLALSIYLAIARTTPSRLGGNVGSPIRRKEEGGEVTYPV